MIKKREKINMSSVLTDKGAKFLIAVLKAAFLICMCFVVLYPILYMVSMALRTSEDLHNPTVIWIPMHFTLENFTDVFGLMNYEKVFFNTLTMAVLATALNVAVCACTAYGLARFKFKINKLIFFLCIFTIIVPAQCISTPLYLQFRNFDFFGIGSLIGLISGKNLTANLLNSYGTMLIPAALGQGLRSGLFIYIFQQFFRGLPRELEDAANVDGCSIPRTFISVMIPNAKSAIVSCILFSFVWYWNDYYMSNLFFSDTFSLNGALAALSDTLRSNGLNSWEDPYLIVTRMQAGCLLVILPMLIVYIFLQRLFTESIDKTGIVG